MTGLALDIPPYGLDQLGAALDETYRRDFNIMRNTTISLLAPEALSATKTGSAVDVSSFSNLVDIILNSAATGGAGHTSTVKIQHSDDGSTNWTDVTGMVFAVVTNAAASCQTIVANVDQFKKYIRGVNTLAGSSPTVVSTLILSGKQNYA